MSSSRHFVGSRVMAVEPLTLRQGLVSCPDIATCSGMRKKVRTMLDVYEEGGSVALLKMVSLL